MVGRNRPGDGGGPASTYLGVAMIGSVQGDGQGCGLGVIAKGAATIRNLPLKGTL
jgi:hypothetical protein